MGYGKIGFQGSLCGLKIKLCVITGIGLSLFALNGCNVLGLIDSPSGDAQILSKARACFDQGDFTCSSKYYGLLSSVSSDSATSEGAFEALAQNGATMAVFMNAAVNGSTSGGKFLTQLAGAMSLGTGSNQTRRLAIFHAYQMHANISDTNLKNLVRFLTAASLVAEILGEDGSTVGKFFDTDWVTSPTTCRANTNLLLSTTGCTAPAGKAIVAGASVSLSATTTDASMSGAPTLGMLKGALQEVDAGLTGINLTGGIGSTTQSFTTQILNSAIADPTNDGRFRGILLSLDLGAQ
jgi:hypothetical protein